MAKTDRFTAEQVAAALTATKGMKTLAAKQLGCSYNTVHRYVNEYATVKTAYEEAQAARGDALELKAYNEAMNGNSALLIFLLKTQFKDRGYTERLEIDMRYVPMVKQIEQLAAQRGTSAGDLFNDLISVLSEESSTAPTSAN